jgi:hypothetical protein
MSASFVFSRRATNSISLTILLRGTRMAFCVDDITIRVFRLLDMPDKVIPFGGRKQSFTFQALSV